MKACRYTMVAVEEQERERETVNTQMAQDVEAGASQCSYVVNSY